MQILTFFVALKSDTDVLCDPHRDGINSIIPTRIVCYFPNIGPWISRDLQALLTKEKSIFVSANMDTLRLKWCRDTFRAQTPGMKLIIGLDPSDRWT